MATRPPELVGEDAAGRTLGDLVLAHPEAAALFERLGLDYCCGGRRTLGEECERHGLDPATVGVLLTAMAAEPRRGGPEPHDVHRASIAELCDHIVTAHHEPLHGQLARIDELLGTVVRVHGAQHPELHDLRRLFAATRDELDEHMEVEEARLFPACRALERRGGGELEPGLLALLEDDHAATGDALFAMRELTGGHRSEDALCSTHRALLESLHAFELDLHQHVHEENNVLFPRVRELLAAA